MSLQLHHITDIYVLVDDCLPKITNRTVGRPAVLSDSEIVTILIWNSLTVRQKNLKDIWKYTLLHLPKEFPGFPQYNTFLNHCHRVLPLLIYVLENMLLDKTKLRFVDATMLPVCHLKRSNSHRVAKSIAAYGKNHQGWHYGFKLHASVDVQGRLCGLSLTPANIHDIHPLRKILNEHCNVAVGDGAYNASVMRKKIWEKFHCLIIAPPHPKQKKKILTGWQLALLSARSKIESVYDYLKEHMYLVSSFPRSINGYILHYVRILLGYQFTRLISN